MFFSLVVCTYMRSKSLFRLLESVNSQILYPDEIIIVDGSIDNKTESVIHSNNFKNLKYYRVQEQNRGLTLQRNYGIKHTSNTSEIICFLDDDIVLHSDYFEKLIESFIEKEDALAVGGYIVDDVVWTKSHDKIKFDEFEIDGYKRKLGQRNLLRKKLGLLSHKPPGFMPEFSNGFSIGFLPPSSKIYKVEYFMGGVSAYRRNLFNKISFSERFIGYGLYEDMDFCLRASRLGQLYVNTGARVNHLHEEQGRPNYFRYGKMVIENGYYVWRLKYPKPQFIAKIKFYLIHILLMAIRFINGLSGDKSGIQDVWGRLYAFFKLNRIKGRSST